MNKVELHILVDVNVYINALEGKPVVTTIGELYAAMPLLAEISAAPSGVARLSDSDHIVGLVHSKVRELLGYSDAEASRLTELILEVSRVSRGIYTNLDNGLEQSKQVEGMIPARFRGTGKGQIDHEDLQVLGAAAYPLVGSDATEMALVVTSDGGFHNISDNISPAKILVAHTRAAITAVRAAAAHAL